MSYRVFMSVEAEEQVLEVGLWWLVNRPKAPDLFTNELAGAQDYLTRDPLAGVQLSGRHRGLRWVMLHKSRYYVYYRVDESAREVEVMAVWHTSKGSGPPL